MVGRTLNKLNARKVTTLTEEGRHSDGGGLYLSIGPGNARRWVFLFKWLGRPREMGLGSANAVSLARAREKAAEARALIAEGVNPIEARKAARAVPTFGGFWPDVVESLSHQWRNSKHVSQWSATLEAYAGPLAQLPLNRIETGDVLETLKPIWTEKPETASRVRGRIERVLEAAKARGFRTGENPARWKGHLDQLLPARQKLSRGHHPAMPYGDVPAFMAHLRQRSGVAALALEFLILTAARSGEVRGATWSEIHNGSKVWTVPAMRMKGGRDHRVPLSDRAMAILDEVRPLTDGRDDAFIFPGMRNDAQLSDMSLSAVLRRMGYQREQVSVHGFRSSFRDWAGELTDYPRELAEAALAHVVGDATERAYRRDDALERRRLMMEAWGMFVNSKTQDSPCTIKL